VGGARMLPIVVISQLGAHAGRILEAREARDAEVDVPGIVRQSLDAILERGCEPTSASRATPTETSPWPPSSFTG
jgi:hypothetical protein